MPVVALIEIWAKNVARVRERLEAEESVLVFYELVGKFNIGVIVEVEDKKAVFEIVTLIRNLPGVEETKTQLVQDGVVL